MGIQKIEHLEGADKFLIYCAGFEDRSLWITTKSPNYSFKNAFLLKYKSIVPTPSTKNNEEILRNWLGSRGLVEEIEINSSNPTGVITDVVKKIQRDYSDGDHITVDISVMSKYLLLLILRALTEHNLICSTRLVYTEPADYKISNTKLSFGSSKIETVPTFEGMHNPRGDTLLIILLGYEGDRAFSLWEKIEPHECILCYPDPPYKEEWRERTHRLNKEIIAAVGSDNLVPIDPRDPIKIMESLDGIVRKFDSEKKKNCMISPMGTKPQTVGTFLYYWSSGFYPSLIYSSPKAHDEYSTFLGDTYILSLSDLQMGGPLL